MKSMFNRCNSLVSLPDLSKWDTSKVKEKKFMFFETLNLLNIYP